MSFYISRDVGRILSDARRYDEALEALRQAADLNPASGVVYNWMSWIYDKKGRGAQSVEMDLKNEANRGVSQEVLQQLREAHRGSGERGYLEKHVELIKVTRTIGPYTLLASVKPRKPFSSCDKHVSNTPAGLIC